MIALCILAALSPCAFAQGQIAAECTPAITCPEYGTVLWAGDVVTVDAQCMAWCWWNLWEGSSALYVLAPAAAQACTLSDWVDGGDAPRDEQTGLTGGGEALLVADAAHARQLVLADAGPDPVAGTWYGCSAVVNGLAYIRCPDIGDIPRELPLTAVPSGFYVRAAIQNPVDPPPGGGLLAGVFDENETSW